MSHLLLAGTNEISFTPTGLKFPIMKITMGKNTGSVGTAVSISNEQTIYKCPYATEPECLVDLTSQSALDKISAAAKGVSIKVGTYDLLTLSSCVDGKGGTSKVSIWVDGNFTVGGTKYYTDSTSTNLSGLVTTGTTSSFTEISNWGCSTKSIILASPLVVAAATSAASPSPSPSASYTPSVSLTQTLTVLVDNTFLANSIPQTSSDMGGCKSASGSSSRGICVNLPALLPYVGTDSTSTKRFKIAHSSTAAADIVDNTANALIIVPLAGSTPLTVFAGPYYSETSASVNSNTTAPSNTTTGGPNYNTATDVSTFKVNSTGTIAFSQGSTGDTYAGIFSTFSLADHISTLLTRAGGTWYYHAISF